jgi:hypothetical protein
MDCEVPWGSVGNYEILEHKIVGWEDLVELKTMMMGMS